MNSLYLLINWKPFINMKKVKQYRNMGKDGLLALKDDDFYEAIECMCEDAVYDI